MLQNLVKNSKNIIFIDGSYFCFHRYYSMINWWKMTYPLDDEVLKNPYENEIFRDKFISTFIHSVNEIVDKLQLNKKDPYCIIVGKDCKRENIWRTNLFPEYKSGRNRDGFMGKPFFKMVYEEELFQKGGANLIISFDTLEADDCIAISTKFIQNAYPEKFIFIITSDKDYLQLSCSNVEIYNLHYKKLIDLKSCHGDPKLDLFCKIVSGDKSDNISSVLKRCGEKTAVKYYNNPILFENKLKQENAEEKYKFNKLLIDFNQIPEQLQDGFVHKYIL
jgi:5'-3' exonuclease